MDETLTEGFSWQLVHDLAGITPEQNFSWREDYRLKKLDYDTWMKRIETKYRQAKITQQACIQAAQKITFKPYAKTLIKKIQQKYDVYIVSSSIGLYVELVAQQLGISHFHANHHFEFDAEGYLNKIVYSAAETQAKVDYLQSLCQKHKLNPEKIMFVGDSWGDSGAFLFTKRGVLVGPHPEPILKQQAWKSVFSLKEIEQYT